MKCKIEYLNVNFLPYSANISSSKLKCLNQLVLKLTSISNGVITITSNTPPSL